MKGPAPQPPDDLNKQETLRDLSYDQTVKGKSDSPVPPSPPPPASPVPSTRRLDQAPTVRVPGAHPPAPEPPAPPGDKLKPGQRIFQRYRLVRFLGRGAMGLVWLARDEALEIDVALKFLPDALAGDKRSVHALKEEVKRARGLTHRNIIQVFDFNQDEERVGMSMEYVDGETLSAMQLDKERHPGGVFTLRVLRPWVGQLCEALEYAHQEARVVHRDLKPSNLMVSKAGHLKVADFGISRSIAECLTRTTHGQGTKVSGTPPYMSPEHLEGDKPHPTNDIYSLGATLYELLTGQPPFSGGDIPTQIKSKKPLPLRQRREEWLQSQKVALREKIPDEWEETVMDCLAKKAADRPQSAREVAERLGLFETPDGTPRRKRRRWPWALLMGLLVLLGVGGWLAHKAMKLDLPSTVKGPDGKEVDVTYQVDGHPVSPTNVVLKLGSHEVIVERPDYEATTNRIWVIPLLRKPIGSIAMPSQRSAGYLEIKAPAGLSWNVGSQRGETNVSGTGPREIDLPTGEYTCQPPGPGTAADGSFAIMRKERTTLTLTNPPPVQVLVRIAARPDENWIVTDPKGKVVAEGRGSGEARLSPDQEYSVTFVPKSGPKVVQPFTPKSGAASSVTPPARGTLHLDTTPSGVDFEIKATDGRQPLWPGKSPADVSLAVGDYLATAKNQYGSVDQRFAIEESRTREVTLVLPSAPPPPPPPAKGTLRIETVPPGTMVTVRRPGGELASLPARSPLDLELAPGNYRVEASDAALGGTNANVVLTANQAQTVRLDLESLRPQTGSLLITLDPPNLRASVVRAGEPVRSVDGSKRLDALSPGEYTVAVTHELLGKESRTVQIAAGKTAEVSIRLPYATLLAPSRTPWDTITVASTKLPFKRTLSNKTGFPCLLPPDLYAIRVEAKGYETGVLTVNLADRATAEPNVALQKLGEYPVSARVWRNTLGMEFIPVPGLDYLLFGKYEVRIGDFQQFMKAETGHQYNWPYTTATNLDYPAARISWVMATKFCQWLTARERNAGRIGAGQSYDLPSDYEWSIAAGFKPDARPPATPRDRSADRQNDSYPFGTWRADLQPPPDRAGNYLGAPKVPGDEFAGASPVGRFLPAMLFSRGAIPVYDLGGNVKEWVLDFYEDTQSRRRTLRGGSFRTSITDGLISQRESSPESDDSHDDVGFRCVVILDWNVMLDSRARDQAGRILRPPSR